MHSPDAQRICLTLQYDGGAFFGWQLQPSQRTVQGELERVLSRLFDRPARVTGSGRTDSGVHAAGQVATVDAPPTWSPAGLERALNALLPPDVRVLDARVVPPTFHARYGAVSRYYVYRVGLSPMAGSPFHARWCWPHTRPLDRALLDQAAVVLRGEHCFRAFAKAGQEERGDRCTVHDVHWGDWDGLGIELHISANRFLHHMVRYLVGTMVEIGGGRRPAAAMADLLSPGTTLSTSPPAPPQGLFLRRVEYPAKLWGEAGPPPLPAPGDLP